MIVNMLERLRRLASSSTSKDTFISLFGLGIVSGVGMLFTVIMARALDPGIFGVFSALVALITLISSMGDLGISSALINFLPKFKNQRSELVSVSFWFQILTSVFFVLFLSTLSIWHEQIIPGSNSLQFILSGVLIGVYVLQGLSIGIFSADKKFFQNSFVQASDSVLKLVLVAAFFWRGMISIESALLANIISCLISLIYGFKHEMENIKPIFPKQQLTNIFKFAKWIALSRVFSTAISRIDVLLLNLLAGNYQAGIFAAAGRIALLFALLVSSLGNVLAPRFSAFTNHEEIKNYLKKVSVLVGGICLFMLACVLFADSIVLFVFGEKYLAAIPVFKALTVAMIPFLFSIVTTLPLIYYFNKPNIFARLTVIQVALIVLLDLILIPHLYALAPAVSMGIANLLVLSVSSYYLLSFLKQ